MYYSGTRTLQVHLKMLHMKRLYSWTKVLSNSSFQFDRIALCGDVHPQPGPAVKLKYPCKECQRNVCSNQNAILCANCETWSHAKCLGVTNTQFKHYLDNSHIDWICNWCCLPFCNHSKYPPLFRIKKENMQISCQPMEKGHTTTTQLNLGPNVQQKVDWKSITPTTSI